MSGTKKINNKNTHSSVAMDPDMVRNPSREPIQNQGPSPPIQTDPLLPDYGQERMQPILPRSQGVAQVIGLIFQIRTAKQLVTGILCKATPHWLVTHTPMPFLLHLANSRLSALSRLRQHISEKHRPFPDLWPWSTPPPTLGAWHCKFDRI